MPHVTLKLNPSQLSRGSLRETSGFLSSYKGTFGIISPETPETQGNHALRERAMLSLKRFVRALRLPYEVVEGTHVRLNGSLAKETALLIHDVGRDKLLHIARACKQEHAVHVREGTATYLHKSGVPVLPRWKHLSWRFGNQSLFEFTGSGGVGGFQGCVLGGSRPAMTTVAAVKRKKRRVV